MVTEEGINVLVCKSSLHCVHNITLCLSHYMYRVGLSSVLEIVIGEPFKIAICKCHNGMSPPQFELYNTKPYHKVLVMFNIRVPAVEG